MSKKILDIVDEIIQISKLDIKINLKGEYIMKPIDIVLYDITNEKYFTNNTEYMNCFKKVFNVIIDELEYYCNKFKLKYPIENFKQNVFISITKLKYDGNPHSIFDEKYFHDHFRQIFFEKTDSALHDFRDIVIDILREQIKDCISI